MKWENVNSIIWSAQHSDGRGLAVLFLEVTGCSMFYNHESGNHVSALLVFSLVFYFVKGGAILSVRGIRGQRWVYCRSRVVIFGNFDLHSTIIVVHSLNPVVELAWSGPKMYVD